MVLVRPAVLVVLVAQAAQAVLVAQVAQAVHQAVHQAAQVIVAEVTNGLRQSSKRWQC